MNREIGFEQEKNVSPIAPAIESFFHLVDLEKTWLKEVAGDKEFLAQLESRKKLNERLDVVISSLPRPDVSLSEAVSKNFLTENQVADLYTSLSELLEGDSDYKRLALYLPFEFLPNTTWKPSSEPLKLAKERFQAAYMAAWNRLLNIQDVRANFVGGDVLEAELRDGDHPRVVKAAHLIPKLVESGFLEMEKVFELMEETFSEVIRRSIADTLPVLADLGFIHERELARIRASFYVSVRAKADIITSPTSETDKPRAKDISLLSVEEQLDQDFQNIDEEKFDGLPINRAIWLKAEKKRIAVESVSEDIKIAIIGDKLSDETLTQFIAEGAQPASQQALVEGIRKAIESAASIADPKANELYAKYREALTTLWKLSAPEIHDALSKTFCRLHGLRIVDDGQLKILGIVVPALAGPFSENLKTMEKEMSEMREIVASLEKSKEIQKYIFPVALIFGSRLKGYGSKTADLDVAVFVKPGTSPNDLEKIKTLVRDAFSHKKIEGKVLQFWLEKSGDKLAVRDDLETLGSSIGDSSWTHVLFGAAWEGNNNMVEELRRQLLVPYLFDQREKRIYDREARELYLEELERDTLQYRLMHKGYERFFPSFGGLRTPHADSVDGQSIFWDSGYRQVATKLFVSRVFLPKVSKP